MPTVIYMSIEIKHLPASCEMLKWNKAQSGSVKGWKSWWLQPVVWVHILWSKNKIKRLKLFILQTGKTSNLSNKSTLILYFLRSNVSSEPQWPGANIIQELLVRMTTLLLSVVILPIKLKDKYLGLKAFKHIIKWNINKVSKFLLVLEITSEL